MASTLELSQITPMLWFCRHNSTGIDQRSFDASCVAVACLDGVIEVHMLSCSSASVAALRALLNDMKSHFIALGYQHYRYQHNGRIIQRTLRKG